MSSEKLVLILLKDFLTNPDLPFDYGFLFPFSASNFPPTAASEQSASEGYTPQLPLLNGESGLSSTTGID